MSKYKPYVPSRWESRIDNLVRLVSPRMQTNRMVAREREHYFRYLAALPSASRANSTAQTSGETWRGAREKQQVMWNAINAVDNSGLCTSIINKFQMYVCGTLRWQCRCGDRQIATEYEDYMKVALGKSLDYCGRFSLRQMAMLDLRAILVKGDVGCNIVRDGSRILLQGIEADRIGNPYEYRVTNNYVRGLTLDDSGRMVSAKVFYRDRPSGTYRFEQEIPFTDANGLPRFLFIINPISYDDYRGVSVFKTAIDSATYIDSIRQYELQALMWAASQSGVFHTKSGALPEGLPFDSVYGPLMDDSGNTIQTYQVRPNTVTALGVGEDVQMFQHDRPSPNVINILHETVRDIAVGTGLSFGMVWDMSGYTGPAVRAISSQDARTIEIWQWLIREGKLDPVVMLVLGNAIANGDLPFHPLWYKWEWFFPSKSTIDVGRESQANIEEINAGINTGARVASDDGMDIDEIQIQRGREVEAMIEVAQNVAQNVSTDGEEVPWQTIYQMMCPQPGKGGGGPMPPPKEDGPGVTTNGAEIGGAAEKMRGRNGNGHQELVLNIKPHVWYSEDQARDDRGRWTDDGGGNGATIKDEKGAGDAPKVGEPFVVYRLGKGNPLKNSNAGNAEAVAMHLAMIDDPEAPQPMGGTGDRVAAYRVTPKEDWGHYEGMITKSQNVPGHDSGKIGRQAINTVVRYSFPESGKFDHEKIDEVPLTELRGMLKEMHGADSFDWAGATEGAKVIRQAFKNRGHNFREPYKFYREDQARDDHGRFADEGGGEPTPLTGVDKAIADYKPDRSLSDPSKVTSITKSVPGIGFTPYSKTPFFDHVNTLQGSDGMDESGKPLDPLRHGVGDYIRQRDLLFQTIPSTKIKLDDPSKVVATQEPVNTDRVQQLVDDPSTGGSKAIQVVMHGGKQYILNGHHRVAALMKGAGSKEIDAHVLDLDHPEPKPPSSEDDVSRYVDEMHQMPDYRTVIDRLNALGTPAERESFTLRQHLNAGGQAKLAKGIASGLPIEKAADAITVNDLTPDRQMEHARIVDANTNRAAVAAPDKKPIAVILMGKPAAGKTKSREAYVDKAYGVQFTTINTDDLRNGLSDYRGWNAAATQQEAKLLNEQLTERALGDRHNVVFDEVGGGTEKMKQKVGKLGKLGYDVHLVHVDAPMKQTLPVSWDRFKKTGRFVDADYQLNQADNKPIATYNELKQMPQVKSWKSIDNEGFKGILTDQGSRP